MLRLSLLPSPSFEQGQLGAALTHHILVLLLCGGLVKVNQNPTHFHQRWSLAPAMQPLGCYLQPTGGIMESSWSYKAVLWWGQGELGLKAGHWLCPQKPSSHPRGKYWVLVTKHHRRNWTWHWWLNTAEMEKQPSFEAALRELLHPVLAPGYFSYSKKASSWPAGSLN